MTDTQIKNPDQSSGTSNVDLLCCPFCGKQPTYSAQAPMAKICIGGWSSEVALSCCITMSAYYGESGDNPQFINSEIHSTEEQAKGVLFERWNNRYVQSGKPSLTYKFKKFLFEDYRCTNVVYQERDIHYIIKGMSCSLGEVLNARMQMGESKWGNEITVFGTTNAYTGITLFEYLAHREGVSDNAEGGRLTFSFNHFIFDDYRYVGSVEYSQFRNIMEALNYDLRLMFNARMKENDTRGLSSPAFGVGDEFTGITLMEHLSQSDKE